jgi:hypothetical protein
MSSKVERFLAETKSQLTRIEPIVLGADSNATIDADAVRLLMDQAKALGELLDVAKANVVEFATPQYVTNGMGGNFAKTIIIPGKETSGLEVSFKNQFGLKEDHAGMIRTLVPVTADALLQDETTVTFKFTTKRDLKAFVSALPVEFLSKADTRVKVVTLGDLDQLMFKQSFDPRVRTILQSVQTVAVGAAKKKY